MYEYPAVQCMPSFAADFPELIQAGTESAATIALNKAMRAGHTRITVTVDDQPRRTSAGVEMRAVAHAEETP